MTSVAWKQSGNNILENYLSLEFSLSTCMNTWLVMVSNVGVEAVGVTSYSDGKELAHLVLNLCNIDRAFLVVNGEIALG